MNFAATKSSRGAVFYVARENTYLMCRSCGSAPNSFAAPALTIWTVGRPSRQAIFAALQSRPLTRTVCDKSAARSGPIGRWRQREPAEVASTHTYGDPVVHALPAHSAQRRRRSRAGNVCDVLSLGIRRRRPSHSVRPPRQDACFIVEASPPWHRDEACGEGVCA